MSSNVRAYTDKQLLDRVEQIGGIIPNKGKALIIGVQSTEDSFNLFDDKFYLFNGPDFMMVSTGTTNAGKTALKSFDQYDLTGAAVWQTDQWCPDVFEPGLHKQKMRALRQVEPITYYRDNDKDNKAEQIGVPRREIIYANMHGVSYDENSELIKEEINGWSFACQVWNNMSKYWKMIDFTWDLDKRVDYALLREFDAK